MREQRNTVEKIIQNVNNQSSRNGSGNDSVSLTNAKKAKKDEFYTQLTDIEKELRYYTSHFKNKVVYCNCDDPEKSNFWVFFRDNFNLLGLKKLISTHYENGKQSYKMEQIGPRYEDGELKFDNFIKTPLKGDGDFRSDECIEILKEADIVVTNPPFSLFREFLAQLMKYKKKFLVIGNINAVSCKEVFPLIRDNKIWMGASIHSGDREFRVPDDYPLNAAGYRVDENGTKFIRVKGVRWFTNMDYPQHHEDLILYKTYNPDDYPTYDNYNAINVDVTKEIPCDYYEAMGVPITFLDKYNPEQFEILDANDFRESDKVKVKAHGLIKDNKDGAINGSPKYVRILIKRK